jgi:hypothetical protein
VTFAPVVLEDQVAGDAGLIEVEASVADAAACTE